MVPVNRCFDTIVDDDLVSSNTVHGIAMEKLYSSGKYKAMSLNNTIQQQLQPLKCTSQKLSSTEKRNGNLDRYQVGTIAKIEADNAVKYFLLGLSSFSRSLHATTTDEDYVLVLMRLLKFCNERSQGFPVIIPLIGGGASGTRKDENDILQYIISLLKMNRKLINCDVHIVVRPTGKKSIAIA